MAKYFNISKSQYLCFTRWGIKYPQKETRDILFLAPERLDEMLAGPFKKWNRLHKFKDNNNPKQAEVIDEISFELPDGPIGKLFEGYADMRLQKLFDYRKEATIRNLEGKNT